MSKELLIQVIDASTQESEIRAFTSSELNAYQTAQTASNLFKAEEDAKAAARQSALAKLAALGLTEAEIAAL
jgi:DNA-binding NarL/FixJ family response regulator